MDHRSFSPNGPISAQTVSPRWWTLKGEEAAGSVSAVLQTLKDHQQTRVAAQVAQARLYGNLAMVGMGGVSLARQAATHPAAAQRLTYNVVQSVIDTVAAKIAKNKPKPYFLTSGGDYKQQRKAKKLNQFCEGVFYENDAHAIGIRAFVDGAVWGDGWIHVFARNGRVAYERVLGSELWVDELEGIHGDPRQMHRIKSVDRHVLLDAFPGARAAIMGASAAIMPDESRPHVADLVEVRESWHLPSGPDAKDGKHIITVDGHALCAMETWDKPWFPFARFSWTPRPYGYWAQGLAEQLQNIQFEINKLLWIVQRSMHLAGSFKVMVPIGSKVVKEHLNNDVGAIIEYSGDRAPAYVVPQMVPPEVLQQIEKLKAAAYEQAGVSQLSAASQKPAGLNSGKALREYNDIESDRFQTIGQAYERLYLQLAKLSIATVKEIAAEGGNYEVRVPAKRFVQSVDWKHIDLEEDDYVMQCFPVSSLPNDPAGRLQTVQEYAQAGYLTPRQAKRLLDFPDLQADQTLSNASEEYLTMLLEKIVDDGEYTPPEPFDDLQLARELALEFYEAGKSQQLEEERLEMLRRFIGQVQALEEAATPNPAPAPSAGQPQAPAVPLQPSDLVPNVPAPGIAA